MSVKRKAAHIGAAASPDHLAANGTPLSKRRKLPESPLHDAATITKIGLELLDLIKSAKDKHGAFIADAFLELPSRKEIPEYYTVIELPIALNIIQTKLKRHQYADLGQVEADIKRMVTNAKTFNEKNSTIWHDAEKIRKQTASFMLDRNPAYQDKSYQVLPTPIPTKANAAKAVSKSEAAPGPTSHSKRVSLSDPKGDTPTQEDKSRQQRGTGRLILQPPAPIAEKTQKKPTAVTITANAAAAPKAASKDVKGSPMDDFKGKSLHDAQDQIVTEMLELEDDEGYKIAASFVNLPPRSLTDYFQTIKQPMSLKGLQRSVRGIKGNSNAPALSAAAGFRTWKTFEEAASLIWKNAHEYNEEGSEIVQLADKLKEYFEKRVKAARKHIPEPSSTRVKLTMGNGASAANENNAAPAASAASAAAKASPVPSAPPKIKLTFGGTTKKKPTHDEPALDGETEKAAKSEAVDGDDKVSGTLQSSSLDELAVDSADSVPKPEAEHSRPRKSRSKSRGPEVSDKSADKAEPNRQAGKDDAASEQAQQPSKVVEPTDSKADSDAIDGRAVEDASAQETKNGQETTASDLVAPEKANETAESTAGIPATTTAAVAPPAPAAPSTNAANAINRSSRRSSGKGLADALIQRLCITTHPESRLSRRFKLDMVASSTKTRQSVTATLPSSHAHLRITPYLSPSLAHRPSKTFVTCNNRRQQPIVQRDTSHTHSHPTFDQMLLTGLNTIEVEVVAGSSRGLPKTGTDPDFEMEKFTVFFNLQPPV